MLFRLSRQFLSQHINLLRLRLDLFAQRDNDTGGFGVIG